MCKEFFKKDKLGVMWSDAPLSIIQELSLVCTIELQKGRILLAKFVAGEWSNSFVESKDNNCLYCSAVSLGIDVEDPEDDNDGICFAGKKMLICLLWLCGCESRDIRLI